MSAVDVNQNQASTTSLGQLRAGAAAPGRESVWQRISRDKLMLLMVAPGVIYFALFDYLPLLGYIIAFQDYLPFLGFYDSPFVGFANFQAMFNDAAFWQAFSNTIIISMAQIVFYFPAPICLALLLHGVISTRIR